MSGMRVRVASAPPPTRPNSSLCKKNEYDPCRESSDDSCGQLLKKDIPERLGFTLEWVDREADLVRKYLLTYYHENDTIEITDLMNHRRFLRRLQVGTVSLPDLYLGNILNIYGRPMTVVAYGDPCTRQYLEPKTERAFLLVKPDAVKCIGKILQVLENNFRVLRAKMVSVGHAVAHKYYEHVQGQTIFAELVKHITSGPSVAFTLVGENAVARLTKLIGEDINPADAILKDPRSLRALYGTTLVWNAFDVADSPECVNYNTNIFFPESKASLAPPTSARLNCTTCCIIKPHAVKAGLAGDILVDIAGADFQVTAFEMFHLNRTHAEELYEVYKGVLPEYSAMTAELSLGPCYAIEIAGCGEDTPRTFRELVGPWDIEIAKQLRPATLRAKYGQDKVNNAVHCTDLPQDAQSELEYLFRVLQV